MMQMQNKKRFFRNSNMIIKHKKMKKKRNFLAGIIAMIALATLGIAEPALAQQPGVKRTDLQRHDLSRPGYEVVQVRIDFNPGAVAHKHKHPGEEIIYVLAGLLEYQVEGKPPVTLKAGEVLFIQAGTTHAAKNLGKGNAAELATYVVEKGKPLVVLTK